MRRPSTSPTGASKAMSDGKETSATACNCPTPRSLIGRVRYQDQLPVVGLYIGPSMVAAPGRESPLVSDGTSGNGKLLGLGRAAAQTVPSGRISNRSLKAKVWKLKERSTRRAI